MKKKHVPVLVAIILIIIIIAGMVAAWLIDKYSYSKARADLNEYFGTTGDIYTPIIYNDEIIEKKAVYQNGEVYLPMSFIEENLDDHFYRDVNENLLLYTNATDIYRSDIGSDTYTVGDSFSTEGYVISMAVGEDFYIATDYLKKFCNYEYAYYPDPGRVTIRSSWGQEQRATAKKDTWVRVLGGIKSDILCDLPAGTEVKVLEEMDDWDKVETVDGFIGYTEKKVLSSINTVDVPAVNDVVKPEYTVNHLDGKVCLVWNMVTNKTANSNAGALLDNTKGVNVISPTWYSLSDDHGGFISLADPDYVSQMHNRGIQVWALLENFTNKDVSTENVVNNTTSRQALVRGVVDSVLANNIDGINVDFELVSESAADGYIQFLRELSIECRKSGIILSADNSYLVNYSKKQQGEVVDYVIIMGYDEHVSAADGAGSVASLSFVQSGIDRTLENVSADKVINGVPFYTRLWTLEGSDLSTTAYSMTEIENFLAPYSPERTWDGAAAQNYIDFTADGKEYMVWIEDSESMKAKLDVMEASGLAGVAGWRLGQESPEIWDVISAYLAQ